MNKIIFLFYILISAILYSQEQLHVRYLYVRSPIANVYEDLYTNGTNVVSIQNGDIMFTNSDYVKNRKKGKDHYFISKINSSDRDFFFTEHIDNKGDFFIYDQVPKINWYIDEGSSKKILGYNCVKATAIFRGSPITAYFTKELPYSVGPFKFYGLPGVILDIRADGKDYDLWKAIKVDKDDKSKIDYNPEFPQLKKMKMKDFIDVKDGALRNFTSGVKVPGSIGQVVSLRLEIEKEFEWENTSK